MSGYKLFSQLMSYFYRYSTCFNVFIPRPVTTCFLRFFAVPVCGSCILKLSRTGQVRGPSKKGNRTETGPDFKALVRNVRMASSVEQLERPPNWVGGMRFSFPARYVKRLATMRSSIFAKHFKSVINL